MQKQRSNNNTDLIIPKVGSGPRFIADKLNQGRDKIMQLNVPDDVHFKDLKNADWKTSRAYVDTLQWGGESIAQGMQMTGATTLWILEYLLRLLNGLTLDNFALRGIERGAANVKVAKLKKDSKWSKFKHIISGGIKKHPTILAYVSYYALMNLLIFGGVQGVRAAVDSKDKNDKNKKEVVKDNNSKSTVVQPADKSWLKAATEWVVDLFDGDEKRVLRYVDPSSSNYIQKALDAYWPEIAVGLTELETYRAEPKRHDGEKRLTNGLGCTWFYSVRPDGTIERQANLEGKTPTLSTDENYEQCKLHLQTETLSILKSVTKNKKNISARHAIALVYAGYQRPADMRGIARKIEKAKTMQEVADAFAHYEGREKWKKGTLIRRWVCAAYAVGLIDTNDILAMVRDSFSALNINTVYKNGHFVLTEQTAAFVLSRKRDAKNPDKNTVKTFLADFKEGKKVLEALGNVEMPVEQVKEEAVFVDNTVDESLATLIKADAKYKDKKYKEAIDLYNRAIKQNPDNMEAYSSLALAYLRLGEQTNSIENYEKCLRAVRDGNVRMNANKSLLLDREIKASSYYNAGLAHENIAQIYESQGKKDDAKQHYKSARDNYKTALDNAEMIDMDAARQNIYQDAINRTAKKIISTTKKKTGKGKKLAFNTSEQKLKPKHTLLYGKEYSGNSIA